ncbi:hypothetical protein GCM10027610_052020 [Dactylosporangium cerinum]
MYDLGAGTFDASVVRSTGDGFDVLAEHGLPDAGGLDIDAAIVAHLGATYAQRDPETWQRLTRPATPADRRAAHAFREDVRVGKEILSRTASTLLHVPIFDDDALLTRVQLEQLALPILQRTMRATQTALREAGVGLGDLAGVFLVGGAARMPLAGTLLHRQLGVTPTVVERPELVVAEGSILAGPQTASRAGLTTAAVTTAVEPVAVALAADGSQATDSAWPAPPRALAAAPPMAAQVAPVTAPAVEPAAPDRPRRGRVGILAGVVAALVFVIVTLVLGALSAVAVLLVGAVVAAVWRGRGRAVAAAVAAVLVAAVVGGLIWHNRDDDDRAASSGSASSGGSVEVATGAKDSVGIGSGTVGGAAPRTSAR